MVIKDHGEPPLSMLLSVPTSELLWCHHASPFATPMSATTTSCCDADQRTSQPLTLILRFSYGVGSWEYHRGGELVAALDVNIVPTACFRRVCRLSCAGAQCRQALYTGCPCLVSGSPTGALSSCSLMVDVGGGFCYANCSRQTVSFAGRRHSPNRIWQQN